jgi:hypothetical protein
LFNIFFSAFSLQPSAFPQGGPMFCIKTNPGGNHNAAFRISPDVPPQFFDFSSTVGADCASTGDSAFETDYKDC